MNPRGWGSVAGLATSLAIGIAHGWWMAHRDNDCPDDYPKIRLVQRPDEPKRERRVKAVVTKGEVIAYENYAQKYNTVFSSHPSALPSREQMERDLHTKPATVHDLPARLPRGSGFGFPPRDMADSYGMVIYYGDEEQGLREWNWDIELHNRERLVELGRPYVITKEEFEESEPGYDVEWLFFFPREGILCDESYRDLGLIDTITGPLPFGHGHHEDDKICIRNEMIETDFEVSSIEDEAYGDWVERQVLSEDKLSPGGTGDGHASGAS